MITFYHYALKVRVDFLRQQIEKVVNKANSEKRKRAVVRTQRRQTNNKKVSDRYSAFVSI